VALLRLCSGALEVSGGVHRELGGTIADWLWIPAPSIISEPAIDELPLHNDNIYTMLGAFRATNPLSGGLLWCVATRLELIDLSWPFLTTVCWIGRSHGGFRNFKKHDSENDYARWTMSSQFLIEPWLSRASLRRLRRGGRRRCRLSRKWYPRINTPSLIERRRSIGRLSIVSTQRMVFGSMLTLSQSCRSGREYRSESILPVTEQSIGRMYHTEAVEVCMGGVMESMYTRRNSMAQLFKSSWLKIGHNVSWIIIPIMPPSFSHA
jgi:hypothetical protein